MPNHSKKKIDGDFLLFFCYFNSFGTCRPVHIVSDTWRQQCSSPKWRNYFVDLWVLVFHPFNLLCWTITMFKYIDSHPQRYNNHGISCSSSYSPLKMYDTNYLHHVERKLWKFSYNNSMSRQLVNDYLSWLKVVSWLICIHTL